MKPKLLLSVIGHYSYPLANVYKDRHSEKIDKFRSKAFVMDSVLSKVLLYFNYEQSFHRDY